ncbi:MAG TPA: hypothetical protein VFC68_01395 [Treponemataceae bacterium]|nr:hypothetical protein [Treponemataceae bacterium]
MTKEGFKKGLIVFKTAGLKAAPDIKREEFQDMYQLWNQILRNPDDDKFYKSCLKYCESEKFFPAVSQIKNIIDGRQPNQNPISGSDPYASFTRY